MALWLLSPSGGSRRSFDGTQILLQRSKGRHGRQSLAERAVRPEEAEELTEAIEVLPEVPEEPAADAIAADKKEVLRRVYIRQTDLDSHGYTAGCPACDAIRTGYSREGILHSESCRSRVVGKLGESEEGRKRLEAAKRSELPKRFRKAEELKVRTEGYECRFDTGPSLGRTVVVFIGICCTKA